MDDLYNLWCIYRYYKYKKYVATFKYLIILYKILYA